MLIHVKKKTKNKTKNSAGLLKSFILYFTPLHCGLPFLHELYLPQHLTLRYADLKKKKFASLFAGFYFLFTSAVNLGLMFTLASDVRSLIFYVRTRREAEIFSILRKGTVRCRRATERRIPRTNPTETLVLTCN